MNYFEHHIGDYDTVTAHLTACEDGIYSRLIRWYYASEQPLPLDVVQIQRRVRAHTRDEKAAVKTILQEFFEQRADGYHQHRCDEEIARYQDKQRKARASADARWSKSERNANASPDAHADDMRTHMRTQSEGNATRASRADAGARPSPDTSHQTPLLHPEDAEVGGPAPSAAPPSPPPPFDGKNAETLNGKAVVALSAAFELPAQWGLDAEALGFKPDAVFREGEKFRQYWTAGRGAGTRRNVKGWRQTWSNWLEKAARDQR